MKYKLLIIFLFSCLFSYIIYYVYNEKSTNILILGDTYLLNKDDYSSLLSAYIHDNKINGNVSKMFVSSDKNYRDIINDIKNEYSVIDKGIKVYLNQSISSSNYIILNANNTEYFNKYEKDDYIINDYNSIIYNDIEELTGLISKISRAKIILIGNYCKNGKNTNQNSDINIEKHIKNNPTILDFNKMISKEGEYYIYNKLIEIIN